MEKEVKEQSKHSLAHLAHVILITGNMGQGTIATMHTLSIHGTGN
jgi:hypothetical protein